jgi:hypothetical protein
MRKSKHSNSNQFLTLILFSLYQLLLWDIRCPVAPSSIFRFSPDTLPSNPLQRPGAGMLTSLCFRSSTNAAQGGDYWVLGGYEDGHVVSFDMRTTR